MTEKATAHLNSATRQAPLELIPPVVPAGNREPEQLPLIRMLEVVRDRVESIHASQHTLAEELRDIRANLPLQRRPLSRKAQLLHIRVIAAPRHT